MTPPARVVSGGYYARPRRHQLRPALGVVESSSATETSRPPAPSTAKERRMRYRACDNTWVCDCGAAWSGPLLAARVAAFPDGFDFAEAA